MKLKKLTVCNYHMLEKRTYKSLGHIRVDKISPLDIQKFVKTLMDAGLAPNSLRNYIRFVSVILNYAVKKRVALYNPCTTADLPKLNQPKRDFYSIEEGKEFLEHLRAESSEKFNYAVFFTLAMYTGCRKGELLGLEFKDIDFENNIISINRAYYYSNYDKITFTDTPKSANSIRNIKVPRHIIQLISKLKRWQKERRLLAGASWEENDRLFTDGFGKTLHPRSMENYLFHLCKRTGMRKVKIHSFRHFNASVLISKGVDVVTVQHALGHSSASTTLSVYSHAFNTSQTKAMEAIAQAIDF